MQRQPIPSIGRRIIVVGTSGSGKTYLAERLAQVLGVPYVCNDAIIHRPNWQPNPPAQRLIEFEAATRGDGWTFDGNIGSMNSPEDILIVERADTMVWIDLPRHAVMRQLLRRTISRSWHKTELWHGNRENWRLSFFSKESILWWAWQTYPLRKKQYNALLNDPRCNHLTKIRLQSRAEIGRWLAEIEAAPH